jgi:hypothetical protein
MRPDRALLDFRGRHQQDFHQRANRAFNITGKSGGSPGLISFGNNRLSANGADGDAFTTETQE